jgi:hypothetical protein
MLVPSMPVFSRNLDNAAHMAPEVIPNAILSQYIIVIGFIFLYFLLPLK